MDNMPTLPESEYGLAFYDEGGFHDFEGKGYTSDQMHAYARAYAEQRCAPLVEALKEVLQSLEYIERAHPTASGAFKRWYDINRARDALAEQEQSK